jgi:hypothetical protein
MIGFVTGSDGDATLAEGLGDLSDSHSGVVFKGGMARVAMSPPPSEAEGDESFLDWSDACGLLSFVMYALDREDWMAEFIEYENIIRETLVDAVEEARCNDMRSKLTVIEGGKGLEPGDDEDESE